jgi:glycosyltransferase involved in cell wall biosynthesis
VTPEISIILPVCHGGRFLIDALASLRSIQFRKDRFEVVISGDEHDYESRATVESESALVDYDMKFVEARIPSRSAKLNAAFAQTKGRILAFADDDCIFCPDWLDRITVILDQHKGVGAVGGRDVLETRGTPFDLSLDCILNSFIGVGTVRKGTSAALGKYYPRLWNMAVPRRAVESVFVDSADGPILFSEDLEVHEDVELMERIERAGWRLVFAPDLLIRHRRDTSFRSFVKRNFNMARACRSLGVHRFPHIVLTVLFSCIIFLGIGAIGVPPLRLPFEILLCLCLLQLTAAGIIAIIRTGSALVMVLTPVMLYSLYAARVLGYLFPEKLGHSERSGS